VRRAEPVHVGPLLERLHEVELALADDYRLTGERHAVEHDLFHVSHTLAKQCVAHANRLRPMLERYAGGPGDEASEEPSGLADALAGARRKLSEALGRREVPGLLLLRDLTNLFVAVAECELLWTVAGQCAQALRDAELLSLVTICHEETTTQLRWVKTRVKEAAPQVLTVG
jgi:hypothetical protein